MLLADADLDPFFDLAKGDIFRMEALPEYRVDVEQPLLRAYLAGEPYDMAREPTKWQSYIRARTSEGINWRKVRVLGDNLTPYERWECEWGYPASARHGQRTRILQRADADRIGLPAYDWWMFDSAIVLKFHYDETGAFVGAEELPGSAAAAHVAWRDRSLDAGVPSERWWAAHPQYWRDNWLTIEPQQT
ncbi:DUF6879 family protein [Streptodolium elevatio]|uniref:DUF6879 family protein n=1 Tax=Streptodolium elevatio TaxID=3157996 RepID=A0ABV3DK61_9ACTN